MTESAFRMRWLPFYLASALGGLGCSQGNNLFLQGVLAPPQDAGSSGCVFTSDPKQPILPMGILDVEAVKSLSDTYQAVFLVGNTIAPVPCGTCLGSRDIVQSADIRITDATGTQLAAISTLASGLLNPSDGRTPGYGVVEITIVDPSTVDALRSRLRPFERTTIVTYTTAHVLTLDGQHVDSDVFAFPITVCRGCLVKFDTDPSRAPQPNCFGSKAPQTPAVCFAGQDVPFDCHECSAKDPFCLCGQATCK